MSSRPGLDDYYLGLLKNVASRSTCGRRQVAAIVTDVKGRVLATGYNGVPSKVPHCTDSPCPGAKDAHGDTSRCFAVHAEQNALLQCEGNLERAYNLYCSCTPCFTCAKLIANTNIKRVLCTEEYADLSGLTIFTLAGIMVEYKKPK